MTAEQQRELDAKAAAAKAEEAKKAEEARKAEADKAEKAREKAEKEEAEAKAAIENKPFRSRAEHPHAQHVGGHRETMYITGAGFRGPTLINKDQFNSKTMTRVNADGREVDEYGEIIKK